jgi:hypothetical protein
MTEPQRPRIEDLPDEARRIAMALVVAWWQGDEQAWQREWAEGDAEQVARALTAIAEHLLERVAAVGGVSVGEMLHRLVGLAMPRGELDLGLHETGHPIPSGDGQPG